MCNSFNKKFLDEAAKLTEQNNDFEVPIHAKFMEQAIEKSIQSVLKNEGGPFGCQPGTHSLLSGEAGPQ